jgi:hypothetical protein
VSLNNKINKLQKRRPSSDLGCSAIEWNGDNALDSPGTSFNDPRDNVRGTKLQSRREPELINRPLRIIST